MFENMYDGISVKDYEEIKAAATRAASRVKAFCHLEAEKQEGGQI